MAVLESCPKHNMVAYLKKTDGNVEFHEIIDFLTRSSIHYALTVTAQAAEIQSLKAQVKKLKKQARPFILHHKAWLRTVKRKKPTLSTKGESTAQQQSTDRQDEGTDMPKVSTARTKLSTDKFKEDDETIAQVLLNMSQAKAVLKEKEKGSKKRIEEDEESDTESEEITEAKKKFDQIAHDEEVARKIQEEWEAEEERKRLTEEEATKTALSNEYDFIQARIEAEDFSSNEIQFRNQMMTYLKHVGNKKHADLKTKSFDEIKALYEKVTYDIYNAFLECTNAFIENGFLWDDMEDLKDPIEVMEQGVLTYLLLVKSRCPGLKSSCKDTFKDPHMPITTAKEKAQRRLEVKARSTLMMGIPNENQLQKLVSQLELLGEKISQEDVNQKLLRSLSPEWNTHAVVWRNKADLDTMSMDDLYNNPSVWNQKFKGWSKPQVQVHRTWLFLKWSATTATRGDILLGSAELQEIKTTRTRKAQEGVCCGKTSTSTAFVSCCVWWIMTRVDQGKRKGYLCLMAILSTQRCLVPILNTIDYLGKLDGKVDESFFVGYALKCKAFRVFNSKTRIVEENLHIRFSESTPNAVGSGPDWLFDIDALTRTMNYEPIVTCTQSNGFVGTEPVKDYILLPLWTVDPPFSQDPKSSHDDGSKPSSDDGKNVDEDPRKYSECNDQEKEDNVNSTNNVNVASTNEFNVVGEKTSIELSFDPNMPALEDDSIFDFIRDDKDDGVVADMNNLDTIIKVSPNLTTRIHKDHPLDQVIGDLQSATQIRKMSKNLKEHFYVDDIIFGSTKKELCNAFEKLMHENFQMSSIGELIFFLGLQVQQKKDGIFISQDKYVVEIIKKFGFTKVKTASTPMETQKPLLNDEDGEEVDVHMYSSMIGSLMYLTTSRPDIMFAVCACARYQVNPKVSHLHAMKRIFRYLKGQPKLGLWYPKDSPFDLVAYTDNDYAGASLDRKSTIGGCQFLRCRLISWQCKKQTVVANSTTEAEYVATSSCYGQVLWIQNQLLDYGYNFIHTKIFIDNNSTICIIKNPVFH
ncbi:uncharacterized mitochondrial protein-like protein [Tanacetum coccineum]|uniref:Uncharacterized mitochondrial protein-like protein n=1 Tax=Tanacetum coccineum TaxID=301880 RepID=A0ABQ5IHK2_9ASTR